MHTSYLIAVSRTRSTPLPSEEKSSGHIVADSMLFLRREIHSNITPNAYPSFLKPLPILSYLMHSWRNLSKLHRMIALKIRAFSFKRKKGPCGSASYLSISPFARLCYVLSQASNKAAKSAKIVMQHHLVVRTQC